MTAHFLSDAEVRAQLERQHIDQYRDILRHFARGHLQYNPGPNTPRVSSAAFLFTGVELLLGYLPKDEAIAVLRQIVADLEKGDGQIYQVISLPPKKRRTT